MEYLGDKVHSATGAALSQVRSKWSNSRVEASKQDQGTVARQQSHLCHETPTSKITLHESSLNWGSPLANGIQFGGGSHDNHSQPNRRYAFQAPPTIGFRTDLLLSGDKTSQHSSAQYLPQPNVPSGSANSLGPEQDARLDVSSESLYDGDTWSRLWFQRVMLLCLVRLLLFIRKVYEDFQATRVYNLTGQHGHFLIAATTLFMPTIMFTIYRVARYLQLALPAMRARTSQATTKAGGAEVTPSESETAQTARTVPARLTAIKEAAHSDDDDQLRRALMSSPDRSAGMATPVGGTTEDEGLVTARQSPTTMDEFHDSRSQQEPAIEIVADETTTGSQAPRPPPRRIQQQQEPPQEKLESVNVDKLGDLPDRDSVRVVIGASEQVLHGALFVFWQLKRQVDVVGYLVERACLWRKPADREKGQLNRMSCHRDGLEWFQDFYAAFLAILAQVYTLGLHWTSKPNDSLNQLSASQLNAATSGLTSSGAATSGADNSISQSARVVGSFLGLHATLAGKDVLIMSELIVSSAVIVSLLICVRRLDDGPLTLALSMIGWGSLFAARIIIIALSFVHIGWHIMLPILVLHVLAISGWIYSIALDSHNGRARELDDEAKWDEEAALEQTRQQTDGGIEMDSPPAGTNRAKATTPTHEQAPNEPTVDTVPQLSVTAMWSSSEHVVLLAQILTLFAIPSLFYWPIMFNLKLHLRPFKYLVLVLIQNFLLIPAVWFTISANTTATPGQLYLLGAVGAFSIVGFIFVALYVSCKPSLTEYFARADELFNEAEKSGIYYEFCSRVFKMPDLNKASFKRLMNQTGAIMESQVDNELDSPMLRQAQQVEQQDGDEQTQPQTMPHSD